MRKRILSMVLVLCMVLGMLPANVSAADEQTKTTSIDMTGLASSLMANWGCFGALVVEGVEVVDYSEWTGSGAFGKYQANVTVYVASKDANGTATIHVEAAENENFSASGELVTGTKSTTLVDGVGTIKGTVTSNRSNGSNNFIVNVTFAPAPIQETDTYAVTVNEAENGEVTADKAEAEEGETVTLTVTPASGYELESLTYTPEGGEAVDITEAKSFTMPVSAVTIAATFKLIPVTYDVTIAEMENGTVTAEPVKAAEGETVTLTATPDKGYELESLTVTDSDGAAVTVTDNTFTMPGKAVTVSATFVIDPYPNRVNLKITGYEIGKVAKYASVKMYDNTGKDVTAGEWYCCIVDSNEGCNWNIGELKADTRYWLRIERYISGYKASDFGLLDMEAVSVTDSSGGGNFLIYIELPMLEAPAPTTYGIAVNTAEYGTVIADKAAAAEGDTVTLTVQAADYYELATLTVTDADGNAVTVAEDNTFIMPAKAVTVSATFTQSSGMKQYFTVTVDGVEYPAQYIGKQYYDDANRECEAFLVKLPEGTTNMTVASEYKLYVLDMTNITIGRGTSHNLSVDGAVTIYKLNSYLDTSSPHYCYLRVELPSYDIALNTPENGTLKADKTEAIKGETVTLTVTPDKGYELESLTVPGAEVTKVDDVTYTFPMPGADTEITAVFKEIPPEYYGIILNDAVNGTVAADKTEAVMGEKVQLTLTPAEGYKVDTVTVLNASGAKVSVAEDYSFIMPGSAVDVTVTFKINAKVYVQLEGYELGKKGNQVKITLTTAEGATFTPEYTYIHTATDQNSYYKGELQANTQYWVRIMHGSTGYKASDFALEGMNAVSVTDQSQYQYRYLDFYIELPMLKEPEKPYPINTAIYDGTVKAFVDGVEVTEASAGQTVTLEVTPNDGFTLTDFYVLDIYSAILPITQTGDNTYTFVMPGSLVYMEAWFSTYTVDGNSVITLGDKRGALPGDLIHIPVTVTAPPSGNYYIFDLDVRLPEGWTIEGATEGKNSRLNSIDYWMPTPTTAGRWGLIAQYSGNAGVAFPEGEVIILKIRVPADAEPGTYKLDAVAASLTMGYTDSVASSFGQYVDGYVSVKAKPDEKIKLDTPVITDGMICWYEDLVESRNISACQQDINAVVEYRLAESEEALESAAWITGVVPPDDPRDNTTDSITWIMEEMPWYETNYGNLKANTKYYLQIRYKADNTTCYVDSDPYEMNFTTKAWIEEPVKITTTDAISSPGESFTVKVSLDHVFGDKEFFQKDLSLAFNNEYFTLTNVTKTNFDGSTLPEGEVAELTFTVNDNVAPGEYKLDLTSADPIYLRYYRDGSDYYKHLRQYPVNHEFVSGTITVLETMDAPVLKDASAGENSIEVTAPITLDGVKVEYSISTDDGQTWSAWQESNVFENLTVNTEYQIRARYAPDGGSTKFGPSVPSEAITVKTSYDDITVSVSGGNVLPGETFTADVTLLPELTKDAVAIALSFEYDETLLKLNDAAINEECGLNLRNTADGYEIYSDAAFSVPEGKVITLTFQALENVSGDATISPVIEVYINDTDLMNVEKVENPAAVHIHKVKVLDAVKVTCTADGLTEGKQCELCDEILIEQEAILAKGHKLNKTVTEPAHDKMGYTTYKCENCDFTYISNWTDAIDHKYEKIVSKAATCTEDGEWTFKCECGDTYTQVMPKTGHNCEATVIAPTSESIGYTIYKCKNCDFSYLNNLKDVLEPSECICAPFTDVDTNAWYHNAVDFVLKAKLMNGTSATTFAPGTVTTRAMLVTLLYRMEGEPSVAGMKNSFADVPEDQWYTDAVIWAANEGVVNGISETIFAPDKDITREQMVAMLWRYAGAPKANTDALDGYTDAAAVSGYAKEAMAWAIETGLVTGMTETTIVPAGTATRAQIATILMRYIEK